MSVQFTAFWESFKENFLYEQNGFIVKNEVISKGTEVTTVIFNLGQIKNIRFTLLFTLKGNDEYQLSIFVDRSLLGGSYVRVRNYLKGTSNGYLMFNDPNKFIAYLDSLVKNPMEHLFLEYQANKITLIDSFSDLDISGNAYKQFLEAYDIAKKLSSTIKADHQSMISNRLKKYILDHEEECVNKILALRTSVLKSSALQDYRNPEIIKLELIYSKKEEYNYTIFEDVVPYIKKEVDNCDTVIREEYNSFMKLDNDIDKKVVIVNKLSNNDLREYGYILKLVESGVFSSLEELCEMVHSIIITNDGYLSRAVFYSSDILFYEELKEDNPFLEESEFKVPKVSTLTVINREKLLEEKARSLPDIGKLIDILKVANVLDVSNAYKLTVF